MTDNKWTLEELAVGRTATAVFRSNAKDGSPYRVVANRLDGRRSPKLVLSKDARIVPGVPCVVRVVAVAKPNVEGHGFVEVEWLRAAPFQLEGVYLDPAVSRKLQIALESGLNVLLDGPQGCGKTVTARAVAQTLGMRFVFFNCGAVVEASDFFATIQVRASASGAPVTDFVKTEILEAIELAHAQPEVRTLVFLDELNRCPEHARNALMPALDSTRKVFHPIENRFVEIPDNVQFIAAVNRGRQFSGTFGIDAAQLDRFAPLQMDYLPAHEEVALLVRRHGRERGAGEAGGAVDETSEVDAAGQAQSDVFVEGLPRQVIEDVVAVASAVRASPDLPSTLSVRATEEACVFLEHELYRGRARDNLPEVLQTSFCGRFSGRHDDVGSDAGAVWAIVRRVLKERGVKLPDEG